MEFKKIIDLLSGAQLCFVSPIDTVQHACQKMTEHNERAIPVMTAGHLIGIFSEKDVVQKCVARGLDPKATEVGAVMTTHVQTVDINASIAHAIKVMAQGGFHHLPVVRNNVNVVGMICSDDIPDEYRLLHEHVFEQVGTNANLEKLPN